MWTDHPRACLAPRCASLPALAHCGRHSHWQVAFDEKTDEELLEVLDEVLAQLDTSVKVDPRDETPEQRGNRYWHTLHVCKYNLPTADAEGYKAALLEGDRGVVYPILHYILSKLPQLQKRAYLAKFLMKIEVPPEFMHDEGVQDVSMTYQQLQEEFKEVHKTVDRLVRRRGRGRGCACDCGGVACAGGCGGGARPFVVCTCAASPHLTHSRERRRLPSRVSDVPPTAPGTTHSAATRLRLRS